jgi:hypothetical protein
MGMLPNQVGAGHPGIALPGNGASAPQTPSYPGGVGYQTPLPF